MFWTASSIIFFYEMGSNAVPDTPPKKRGQATFYASSEVEKKKQPVPFFLIGRPYRNV